MIKLARTAGDVIRPFFRQPLAVENKQGPGGYDPVTSADREAERAMRGLLAEYYPQHGVIGEEQGKSVGLSDYTWVLDPIDGTRSFIIGMLHWGTLIALNDGSRVLLGAMYQPITDELFIGAPGQSRLLCSGRPRILRTRSCSSLALATLCCTDPAMFIPGTESDAFLRLARQVQLVRYGGDCYSYGLLAMGLVDLCVESRLETHDVQALIPIVEGAGGCISTWTGGDPADGGRIVAAGDPNLHEQALNVLAKGACG